jgi:hypothetical protein
MSRIQYSLPLRICAGTERGQAETLESAQIRRGLSNSQMYQTYRRNRLKKYASSSSSPSVHHPNHKLVLTTTLRLRVVFPDDVLELGSPLIDRILSTLLLSTTFQRQGESFDLFDQPASRGLLFCHHFRRRLDRNTYTTAISCE